MALTDLQIRTAKPGAAISKLSDGGGLQLWVFAIQADLDFGSAPQTSWQVVQAEITKKCRSEEELLHNLCVARGLHDFASSGHVVGRKHEFFPLAMGAGRRVTYWQSMVCGH